MAVRSDLDLVESVDGAIRAELVKRGDELIDEAIDEIRRKLKQRVAEMALTILDQSYDLARGENRLTITVKLAETSHEREAP